jgi:drug/metabolite transporter (DMT)-like permease
MQSPRQASTLSVVVALGTVYLVWGSTYLAIAYVVETLPPFIAAGARFLLAGIILASSSWRRTDGAARAARPDRSRLLAGWNGARH